MKLKDIFFAMILALTMLSAAGCSAHNSTAYGSESEAYAAAQTEQTAEIPEIPETDEVQEELSGTISDEFTEPLAELLTLYPSQLRENYGEMTYEYSEYGGSPTYSLEKLHDERGYKIFRIRL